MNKIAYKIWNWIVYDQGYVNIIVTLILVLIAYIALVPNGASDDSKYIKKVERIDVPKNSTVKPGIEDNWSSKHIAECYDVTSVDYDWTNDMLCINLDGSRFYTDYTGAKDFMDRYYWYDDRLKR